jgi:hypothetical protein
MPAQTSMVFNGSGMVDPFTYNLSISAAQPVQAAQGER